jgi:threonyl-tRNA synthetase
MIGFLIEHYAGAFPVWLAPQQVRVIPITDSHFGAAIDLAQRMQAANIRAEADVSSDRMNAKIRAAQLMKVPYMIVIGDQELETDTVALRRRDGSRQNGIPVPDFIASTKERIVRRSSDL